MAKVGEDWRPVASCDGYEVNRRGDVFSLKTGTVLTPVAEDSGHLVVRLWGPGMKWPRSFLVHHLVLEAFVEKRPGALLGLHRDDNPLHNAPENLYWGTPSQNALDRVANGRDHNANKTHCPQGHEYSPENTITYRSKRSCRACGRERCRKYRANKKLQGVDA